MKKYWKVTVNMLCHNVIVKAIKPGSMKKVNSIKLINHESFVISGAY